MKELIETNGLYQLIEKPTNIRNEGSSCVDLIITDQPNFFVASGVHPSLDEHCQHQTIYGKLNVSLPSPPPHRRTIYEYSKADVHVIRESVSPFNEHRFRHNFERLSPARICGAAREDTEHYLLHCPQFCTLRQTLLGQVSDVGFDNTNMSTKDLCCLLWYGRLNGSTYINRMILETKISFIQSSKRFA